MIAIDYKWSLAYFHNKGRTFAAVMVGFLLFVVWDAWGIGLGIFFSGRSPYMSGIYLAPQFPLEEVFFLLFLCYFTLIIYTAMRRWR